MDLKQHPAFSAQLTDASFAMTAVTISTASSPASLRQLPPECMELIVRYLWDDLLTLHQLLLCSREFFSMVVPILYRDPFRLVDNQRIWTRGSKAQRTAYLMRILYTCATIKPGQRELEADHELAKSTATTLAMQVPVSVPEESSSHRDPAADSPRTSETSSLPQSPPPPPPPPPPSQAPVLLPVNQRFVTPRRLSLLSALASRNSMPLQPTVSTPASASVDSKPQPPEGLNAFSGPLTTDYLFHYTNQSQIPKAFQAFRLLNPSIQPPHQQRQGFEQKFASATLRMSLMLFGHFPSRIQCLAMTPSQLSVILFKDKVSRTRELSGLGAGLKDLEGVEVLRSLRRLELDFGAAHSQLERGDSLTNSEIGDDDESRIEMEELNEHGVKIRRKAETEDIPLLFIREHQRLFPTSPEDMLDTAVASLQRHWSYDYDTTNSANPATVQSGFQRQGATGGTLLQEVVIRGSHRTWTPTQLFRNIQPLKAVDLSAWNWHVPFLEQIPATRLQSLKVNIARRLDYVQVPIQYLRGQCHDLQEIWMPSQEVETFRWAIDISKPIAEYVSETRIRRRRMVGPAVQVGITGVDASVDGAAGVIASASALAVPQRQESFDSTKVPQLRRVRLYGAPQELVPNLEDAADAFRDSLRELAGFEDGYSPRDRYPRMSIDWSCPHLTCLDLRGRFVYFLEIRSLRQCPALEVVKLMIESNIGGDYMTAATIAERTSGNEGGDALNMVDYRVFAEMRRLRELQLRGTSWMIDDIVLRTLMGEPRVLATTESVEVHEQQQGGCLQESLEHLSIAESHLCRRSGLVSFVKAMKKLKIIHLGTSYAHVVESLKEAAGPRLFVEISNGESDM
ncbi:hypothetical protein EDD11_001732 [Mortierella claussenii]|nr:hypothetical protein EDD11_001732 [Mortierella claussenii]